MMISRIRTFFRVVSRFMSRLWLTVLYFTVVLPFGVMARVRSIGERSGESSPAWSVREERAPDLSEVRKQF
jgi:hypothetical protein